MKAAIELRGAYAFVERSFSLIRRYFAWEVVFVFYNLVNTLTIGLIGMTADPAVRDETVLFLIIGALFWGFMSILFQEVADSITWERWEGTIEYTFMAPVRRFTHLTGMCMFAASYGTIRTIIVLLAVMLFFDLQLGAANFTGALLVLLVTIPAFMGLGLMAAILPLLSPERGTQATHIIQGVILLVSGIYYPVAVLPVWLQPLSWISPGTYALEAARMTMLKGAGLVEIIPHILTLLGMGAILIPLGFWMFRIAEKRAMITGKLKRNG